MVAMIEIDAVGVLIALGRLFTVALAVATALGGVWVVLLAVARVAAAIDYAKRERASDLSDDT